MKVGEAGSRYVHARQEVLANSRRPVHNTTPQQPLCTAVADAGSDATAGPNQAYTQTRHSERRRKQHGQHHHRPHGHGPREKVQAPRETDVAATQPKEQCPPRQPPEPRRC